MEFRVLLLLPLLFLGPGFGQTGTADIDEWLKAKMELLTKLENQLEVVARCQNDVQALEVRLNETVVEVSRQKAEMDKLTKENEDLHTRLNTTEEEVGKLKQAGAAPKVAFSASLAESGELYKGPVTDKQLVFQRVFSNTGDGYDQQTGVFTAPVNGLYYFSFSTYGYNTHAMGALLMKNKLLQVSTYDSPSTDGSDSSGNAVVLPLVAGDQVHMELWDNGRVFDNQNGHTTFSGFLLFPM